MQCPSDAVLNTLGPSSAMNDTNILMDVDEKHPGITLVAFKVASLETAKAFLAESETSSRSRTRGRSSFAIPTAT